MLDLEFYLDTLLLPSAAAFMDAKPLIKLPPFIRLLLEFESLIIF